VLLTTFAAGLATMAAAAFAPTPASASTILLISPSSIEAGMAVNVVATCGNNANSAVVSSRAFGTVTLVPDHGRLKTSVTVPSGIRAGTYSVSLRCASGQVATSKLSVRNSASNTANPSVGPATGGGEMSASAGARLAVIGGSAAIGLGICVWVVSAARRRSTLGN
jgi:hypothetical protein